MARIIVFTSGKGGVGKTTTAANIGLRLAGRGEQVVLCDLDFGLNNLDLISGIKAGTFDLFDVTEGRCRAAQALSAHANYPNLFLLSQRTTNAVDVSAQQIKLILKNLSPQFDFILIDCPAGIGDGFRRAVAAAEEAVVVTTPHVTSIRSADKVIGELKNYKLKKIHLIVNRVREDLERKGELLSPIEISQILKIPLLATVPQLDEIFLNKLSPGKKIYLKAAERLIRSEEEE